MGKGTNQTRQHEQQHQGEHLTRSYPKTGAVGDCVGATLVVAPDLCQAESGLERFKRIKKDSRRDTHIA